MAENFIVSVASERFRCHLQGEWFTIVFFWGEDVFPWNPQPPTISSFLLKMVRIYAFFLYVALKPNFES